MVSDVQVFRPAATGDPVGGFYVQADCPSCGGALEHVADPAPGWRALTVLARCVDCRKHVRARVKLDVLHGGDRHG